MVSLGKNFGAFLEEKIRTDFQNHDVEVADCDGGKIFRIANNHEYKSLSSNGAKSEIDGPFGRSTITFEVRGDAFYLLESSGTKESRAGETYFEGYFERKLHEFSKVV
ncbi:hypothetical protein A2881_00175 [Candidatus Peribacteria bacterium RIFCSPHIGHO2_01_FULL_55_13]|nr:MAG: hypothetical protein A2881_00175 [Candidatus Peribacteria bacterium RIFCSPHIGHO2_01_FULL_55_13]OGJ65272.1 MAG: hypothetical protein A3F36_00325 [Candidatus Peribacteria bacterium RIFCSPHIGHO2_12_FULL_55_11]OGJ71096.1 MAG: hypothetical protein A3G69_00020 [Candidatus Peribacteria bacterium RIFCSPLOWO2_12_FULL_53_10]